MALFKPSNHAGLNNAIFNQKLKYINKLQQFLCQETLY
jgi:hypothetical protein